MSRDMPLQLWGGIECSVVRVGEGIRDQVVETGHYHRSGDLELVAGLGIRTLRYPVLWDRVRHGLAGEDWSWSDARLKRLRELGIDPIAGLLHHGFGPRADKVLDPLFSDAFAGFALAVAQRYPWIESFTPINEPLVTARCSGLYGLWYPHGTDEATCFRLLVVQCRAVAKAMAAIRTVSPGARLVQTEDFGRVFSTAPLRHQADYENERRWLSIDLLAGRVDRSHVFYESLVAAGASEYDLAELASEPCPPDVVGIDHYLTSDRFLAHRTELHPGEYVGGNGSDVYVDIAAVRSECQDQARLALRIGEVWERYHLPLAVTENHNGCTRDEQLRWLIEGWEAAGAARRKGADVRAVTAWALFGMVDWNSMLVHRERHYENDAFDSRCRPPRPTALSHAIAKLAKGEDYDHPAMDGAGWWRRETSPAKPARPIVLSGNGEFRSILEECCTARRLSFLTGNADIALQQPLPELAWSSIHAEPARASERNSLRLSCRFADGGRLEVEADRAADWHCVADACLDLLIDDCRGTVRLLKAEPHNQYELARTA